MSQPSVFWAGPGPFFFELYFQIWTLRPMDILGWVSAFVMWALSLWVWLVFLPIENLDFGLDIRLFFEYDYVSLFLFSL